jgi:methylenetetrahydrofolate dehydrogenase (NADP+) / methenyltetrahydrofolate cyclohydrolase
VAEILDGKSAARDVRERVRAEAARLAEQDGLRPGLAAVLVGDDPASKIYVDNKEKACAETGLLSKRFNLPATTGERDLLALIERLNADEEIHGILLQLPLPKGLDEKRILAAISPEKDVDGLHPVNQGRLLSGEPGLRPCTPLGVIELVERTGIELAGRHAVVVGRSALVGKPVAFLLLERHATVTICHSRTRDLAAEIGRADVLVAAIGKPEAIRGEWIRPGSVVIDVGINRTPAGLRGDVEFAAARERAGWITPVPGGVGPMLSNTVSAASRRKHLPPAGSP